MVNMNQVSAPEAFAAFVGSKEWNSLRERICEVANSRKREIGLHVVGYRMHELVCNDPDCSAHASTFEYSANPADIGSEHKPDAAILSGELVLHLAGLLLLIKNYKKGGITFTLELAELLSNRVAEETAARLAAEAAEAKKGEPNHG